MKTYIYNIKRKIITTGLVLLFPLIINSQILGPKLGTKAGIILTNVVYSSAQGIVGQTNFSITNVATNAGGEFVRADPDKTNGLPSVNAYFTNSIKNWGNATDIFVLSVVETNTNASGGSDWKSWQYWFTDLSGNKITNLKIAPGKTNTFVFVIKPSSNAQTNSWVEYKIVAKSSNSTFPNVNTTIYTGDNNYIYGGPTNSGLGVGSMGQYYITICSQTTLQDNEFIRLTMSFSLPYVSLTISKSVSNITLVGNYTAPIPGATIEYKIAYTLITNLKTASNIIIYDKLPPYITYLTDYLGTATGWTIEYSTNTNPDQSYNSSDYTKVRPPKDKIKWIRWKKPSSGTDENKTLFYKAMIK